MSERGEPEDRAWEPSEDFDWAKKPWMRSKGLFTGRNYEVAEGTTAVDVERDIGAVPSGVDPSQPPAPDMPPLELMVLDGLADAAETVWTMRNCGEMEPDGLALVGDAHVFVAVRSLLSQGLIEVETESFIADGRFQSRVPAGELGVADEDLGRYWFRMTPAGWKAWEAGEAVLEAYYDANPSRAIEIP